MAKTKSRNETGPQAVSKKAAVARIDGVATEVFGDIQRTRKPEMSFPIRALSNVKYDPKKGFFEMIGKRATRTLTYNTVKTFAQSVRLLAVTKNDLLLKNDIAGKREVYYNAKSWGECRFDEQPESDQLLDDMEAMLDVNREQLGYIPEERGGDVTGPLILLKNDIAGKREVYYNAKSWGECRFDEQPESDQLLDDMEAMLDEAAFAPA